LDDDPLNIDSTDEEKKDQKKLEKIYSILLIYILGFSIPFIGFAILVNYVYKSRTLFANWAYPLAMSSFALFIVLFFVGLFFINRMCQKKYGHGIIEVSPLYKPPVEETTKEDDQTDISLMGEKQFKRYLQRELAITIIFSLIMESIGIVIYFMGISNSTQYKWVGYLIVGFFSLISILGIIIGIILYFRRLKRSKVRNDTNTI